MSETLGVWPPTIDEYQRFVESTRREDASDRPWTEAYADYITREHLELMFQHGPVANILLSIESDELYKKSGLHHHAADELGDLLWLITDIANLSELDLAALSARALSGHAGEPIKPATNFWDLQESVMAHAAQVVSIISSAPKRIWSVILSTF
jgi:hypothetical protein